MTVAELQLKLAVLPPNATVVVPSIWMDGELAHIESVTYQPAVAEIGVSEVVIIRD